MRKPRDKGAIVLMSTGVMTTNCLAAANLLAKEGFDTAVLHFHTIKPLDEEALLELACDAQLVVTVEEGTVVGGFGSAVADVLIEKMAASLPPLIRIGLPDAFPHKYGVQEELFEYYGLSPAGICKTVLRAAKTAGPLAHLLPE